MVTCQECNKTWSWKQSVIKSFSLDPAQKCPFCSSKQYLTAKARKRNLISIFIIFIPFLLLIFGMYSALFSFILIFVLGATGILLNPFYIEVSNEETTRLTK